MEIKVNGKVESIAETLSIEDFLAVKNINPEQVVVEYNRNILKHEQLHEIALSDGDSLEILQFVGGG